MSNGEEDINTLYVLIDFVNIKHIFERLIEMVNVTISLPEDLKKKMDEHPETNWSKVCREAIHTYLRILENPIPEINVELKNIDFTFEKGKPGIRFNLTIKNAMKTQITLDRILLSAEFIPTLGTRVNVASDVYLYKTNLNPGARGFSLFLPIDVDTILRINEMLDRPFHCNAAFIAFFEGFKDPKDTSLGQRVPIYDWQKFFDRVVKNEKELMEIKEKHNLRVFKRVHRES